MARLPENALSPFFRSLVDCEVIRYKSVAIDNFPVVSRSRIMLEIQCPNSKRLTTMWIGETNKESPLSIWVDNDPMPFEYFSDWFLSIAEPKHDHHIVVKEFHATDTRLVPRVQTAPGRLEHMWKGKLRLKLLWDDKSVVIGDLTSDVGASNLPIDPPAPVTSLGRRPAVFGSRTV